MKLNRLHKAMLGLLPILISSCIQSPQEKLLGRWYNEANSIRFNADGTLLWNAKQGRATGTYTYSGEARVATSNNATYNLRLNLVEKDRTLTTDYEAEFLGTGHLRLLQAETNRPDVPARILVLKKAENDPVTVNPDGSTDPVPARRRSRREVAAARATASNQR